ncbi:MAG: hypothetical protein ACT4QE_18760 [Anaerolineales bacterium]
MSLLSKSSPTIATHSFGYNRRMVSRAEWLRVAGVSVVILLIVNTPYVLAYTTAAPETFTGILFNTQDGHSYLAKMREGWRGEWLFTLPYTAEPGEGVLLFTYYLFLGHVARWLGLSLDVTYHLARVLGSAAFLWAAYRILAHFFDTPFSRLGAWLFFFSGSGLGWLFVRAGLFTADLWVAESIPFLTLFSNAHFPLAWALLLLILELTFFKHLTGLKDLSGVILAVTALAIVQPMTLLPLNAVLAGNTVWGFWSGRRWEWRALLPVLMVATFSAPWVLYAVWVTNTHPVLSEWNRQNVTASPPWWEALIWGGAPLAMAVLGAGRTVGATVGAIVGATLVVAQGQGQALPLRWLVIGVVLMYLPLDLQRRMSLGVWMPLCILAVKGLCDVVLPRLALRWRPLVITALVLPALFSNLLVYAASTAGVLTRKPELYLSADEAAAMDWVAAQPSRPLVVASPEIALILPGRTDARVIYGHPYETVYAELQRRVVLDFFAGRVAAADFTERYPVDFVFYDPREKALNPELTLPGWRVAFEQGDVVVYGR